MEIHVDKLADAEQRYLKGLDNEDAAALKLYLLSAGALAGLAVKGTVARRVLGLGCTILCAGLAVPLVTEYLEELAKDDQPVFDFKVERGEGADTETLFEARLDIGDEETPEEA